MDTQRTTSSANKVASMGFDMSKRSMLFCMPRGNMWRFYLYGPVTEPEDYIDLINALDSAGEGDEIHIMINTIGGRLDATVSLVHAIQRTLGTVICHADGEVASAGSVIFFSGHQWVINPHATFMLHDGSGGNYGKIGQGVKAAVSMQESLARLYKEAYAPFFTEQEIEEILNGSDHYSDADAISERVESVVEKNRNDALEEINVGDILGQLGLSERKVNVIKDALESIKDDESEEEPEPKNVFDYDEDMEGAVVEVNKPSLKTHGKRGTVVTDNGTDFVVVNIEGQRLRFHTKNLLLID